MKNTKIQITLDVEFDDINVGTWAEQNLAKTIERGLSRNISDYLPGEVVAWDLHVRTIDPAKTSVQVEVTRTTSNCVIHAFFSSDGPAILVSPIGVEQPIDANFLNDINTTIREAHHKYIAKIREDQ
jgi:hypothetical protein